MPSSLERLTTALADRYRIERELGRGGMATVYLAHDLKHDRQVAVKVVHPDLAAVIGGERFLNEIKVTANLQHPHILPLFDSGEADGFLYYVMPYVEGESLRALLDRKKQLPIDRALEITKVVASALGHAHRHGVIHRDIKPENILLADDGQALVADFGIALAVNAAGGTRLTETGISLGTPEYMSPEQATGDRQLEPASDIYSLGAVLYEMLVGDPPHTGSTAQAIIARVMMEQPTSIRMLRETVPEHLEQAVMKALAKVPADRFDSAGAFVEALTSGTVVARGRPRRGPWHQDLRRVLTWRNVIIGGVVASLLWVGVTLGWVQFGGGSDPEATIDAVSGLGEVQNLVGEARYAAAYARARELDPIFASDSLREVLWSTVSRTASVNSEPPGAEVWMRPYDSEDSEWEPLGRTPLKDVRLPLGFPRFRLELEGYRQLYVARRRSAITLKLDRPDSLPEGMVRVPGGEFDVFLPGLEHLGIDLPDFYIDATEVTNREYKRFVDAGGYSNLEYWEHTFVRDGHEIPWEEAVAFFRDRTGRSGPSTWEVGTWPDGMAEHPVGGVSWYEAAAYARFVEKKLPTIFHWYRAAWPHRSQFILPHSNFRSDASAVVGTYDGISSFGAFDMAGNVREWIYNRTGEDRFILGGGWTDPQYQFTDANAQSPFDREPINGFRLMVPLDTMSLAQAHEPIVRPHREYFAEEPVADDIFEVYRRLYTYDPTPLNAVVVARQAVQYWTREEISVDAAYGGERLTLFLYLPDDAEPPYRTIIYFPGSGAIYRNESPPADEFLFSFLIRSGSAVVFPVYKGTYERGTELKSDIQDETNSYREHVIQWSKDLGRSIDYIETRPDIALDRLGYFSLSWGSAMAPVMLAIEDRVRVSVLLSGGLVLQPTQPEVDPFNFLPRVRIPTRMINVPNDYFYPLETSQWPFYHFLGAELKDSVLVEGGHLPPMNVVARETLEWFDMYLGP